MSLTAHGLPPFLLRHLAVRGLGLWALARVTISGFVAMSGGSPLEIGVAATAWTIGLAVMLGLLESRRARERALFANLGLSPLTHSTSLCVAGLLGEITLRVVAAAL